MWLECCLKVRCSCFNNTREARKNTGQLSLPEDIKCSKMIAMLQELMSLWPITVFSSSLLGVMKFLFQLNGWTNISCLPSNRNGLQIKHTVYLLSLHKFPYIFWDSNKKSQIHFCIFNHYSSNVIEHLETKSVKKKKL